MCPPGYIQIGERCLDIDECVEQQVNRNRGVHRNLSRRGTGGGGSEFVRAWKPPGNYGFYRSKRG